MTGFVNRALVPVAFTFAAIGVQPNPLGAQSPAASAPGAHIVIPFLANAAQPADLEFEGADCIPNRKNGTMRCTFQQVFLTTSPVAPDTCLVTTNQYERTFRRETPARWTATSSPEGPCGIEEMTTLDDGGGVRWTMEVRKIATKGEAATCRIDQPATFTWQNIRRPLPCRFVQPGALTPVVRSRPER